MAIWVQKKYNKYRIMWNKLKIIILSRLKKPKKEQWTKDRRKECAKCQWNTKNMTKLPISKTLIKFLSDFYSTITGNYKVDILGNCTICNMCAIFYKSEEPTEKCPKNKWKV